MRLRLVTYPPWGRPRARAGAAVRERFRPRVSAGEGGGRPGGYTSRVELPEPARALLALPPARFVAERDALAKALSAKGDAGAAAVRALRRPLGLAWAMNRLARERPEDVGALLEAGDGIRRGQRRALAGEGAAELRAAETDLRARARALRDAAAAWLGEKAPGALSRLELLLRIAAATPAAREALREGVLEREPEAQGIELSGLAVVAGSAAGPPRPPAEPPAGREGAASGRASRRAQAAAVRAARAALARAEERARRADADARRAEDAARRAEEGARRAEEGARRAAERARELRRRAEQAREEARGRRLEAAARGESAGAAGDGRPRARSRARRARGR